MEHISENKMCCNNKVLFICTGNTCRSPMAEIYFAGFAEKMNLISASAGLYAFPGDAMSRNSLDVLRENGLDGSFFRSQPVTYDLVQQSVIILTMTEAHKNELLLRFPEAEGKCCTLLKNKDISDPFGGNICVYRRTFEEIRKAIDDWIVFFHNKTI